MKNVLIIGTGPLACSIANRLDKKGITYSMASKSGELSNFFWKDKLKGANVIKVDLLSETSQLQQLENIDAVFYTAAPKYWRWPEELVDMVAAGLSIAKKLNAVFVYADNLYAYGVPKGVINEQSPLVTQSRKGLARKEALELVQNAHASGEQQAVVVQSSDFYGPGVDISMLGKDLFTNALTQKVVYLLGKTNKQHSFTYIFDFADALLTVATKPDAYGEVWIAPTADSISVDQYLDKLSQTINKPIAKKVAPKLIFFILGLTNKPIKEIREVYYLYDQEFVVSSQKIMQKFDMSPTTIDDGITATITSYQE